MMKKYLLIGLANLLAASALAEKKPNVLFVIIDDLNDYVSLLENYPGIQTPNLDRFAKTSMNFSRGYCAGPICNPSRTALISGLAPYSSGVYGNKDHITQSSLVMESVLLPEQFQANGYHTMWNGKLFHSRPDDSRLDAMWDDEEGGRGDYGPKPAVNPIPDSVKKPGNFTYEAWTGPDTDFPDFTNMKVNVERLGKTYDEPFFLTYGIYRPHNPWTAPQRFFDMYPLESITMPVVPDGDLDDVPAIGKSYARHPVKLRELRKAGHWKPVVQAYLASISFMDYCLGQVLDALENGPNAEDTIVCVVADHGFHLGEKQHFAKYALWEKTTHTLFMWRVPGMTAPGSVCEATVNLLDIYPTLNELCGLSPVPQTLDGESIVPLLKESQADWERPSLTTFMRNDYAVRDERWRYIRYNDGSEELYDHSKDPNEWTNLATHPEYGPVKASLAKWMPRESAEPVGSPPSKKKKKKKNKKAKQ